MLWLCAGAEENAAGLQCVSWERTKGEKGFNEENKWHLKMLHELLHGWPCDGYLGCRHTDVAAANFHSNHIDKADCETVLFDRCVRSKQADLIQKTATLREAVIVGLTHSVLITFPMMVAWYPAGLLSVEKLN